MTRAKNLIKPGDLVKFAKPAFPVVNSNDCGVWYWKLGIVIEVSADRKHIVVFSEGSLHVANDRLIKVSHDQ